MTDAITLRIVVLRSGLELTRTAHSADGITTVETYRPSPGTILDLPAGQAEAILKNGAGCIPNSEETTTC